MWMWGGGGRVCVMVGYDRYLHSNENFGFLLQNKKFKRKYFYLNSLRVSSQYMEIIHVG